MPARSCQAAAGLVVIVLAACSSNGDSPPGSMATTDTPRASIASMTPGATEEQTPQPTPTAAPMPDSWTQVASFEGDGDFILPDDITHGRSGYLMVTERHRSGEGGLRLVDRLLWHSADALTWEEIPIPEQVGESDFIRQLTATADGEYLMFVQQNDVADQTQRHIVLRSSDGASWQEEDLGLPEDMVAVTVAADEAGYLLAGSVSDENRTILWLSTDGLGWEDVVTLEPTDDEFVTIDDIAVGDEGFVAFGTRTAADHSDYERFSIASTDGREWVETRQPLGEDPEGYRPGVWVEAFGTSWIAVVAERDNRVRTFFSTDGLEWEETQVLEDVGTEVAWDPTLTEIGGEILLSPTGNESVGLPRPLFRSTDGRTWEPFEDLGDEVNIGTIGVGPEAVVLGIQRFPGSGANAEIWVRGR